ncbi:MAG TPA: hypothetical protein VG367_00940 [Mucilaginibacter sp.]|jgi:hypothetical protein|nr:hypothetical protein [Mucilaginibacter sp.]
MKRFLLPAICLLLIVASCKKKNEVVPVNSISATINGVKMIFSTDVHATYSDSGKSVALYGFDGPSPNGKIMQIGLSLNKPITTGTYASGVASPSAPASPTMIYGAVNYINTPESGSTFITDASGMHASIATITSISSTNMQGTFSGTLISLNQSATITDGKFNVNFQPIITP